jgi:uncharacterized protein (DUF983 family)
MIKLKCPECGKKGIPLHSKIFRSYRRNAVCSECGTEYNYSWFYGVLAGITGIAIAPLWFLYLFFHVDLLTAVLIWFFSVALFACLAMLVIPMKKVSERQDSLGSRESKPHTR